MGEVEVEDEDEDEDEVCGCWLGWGLRKGQFLRLIFVCGVVDIRSVLFDEGDLGFRVGCCC